MHASCPKREKSWSSSVWILNEKTTHLHVVVFLKLANRPLKIREGAMCKKLQSCKIIP